MRTKYSKEILEPIVAECTAFSQVLRRLGVKLTGGSQNHIKLVIKYHKIDFSHFTGKSSRRGIGAKKHWTKILVLNSKNYRTSGYLLRRALVESGVKYQCFECGQGSVWNGKKLTLHVHHKDGNWFDNRQQNLKFCCPNCHQQEDESVKKIKLNLKCLNCEKLLDGKEHKFCSCLCSNKFNGKKLKRITKIAWPDVDELQKMIKQSNFSDVGRKLGVSGNAVRKRINCGRTAPSHNTSLAVAEVMSQ